MATYAGYPAEQEPLQDRLQQVQQVFSVAETPNLQGNKRPRSESPLMFGNPDYNPVAAVDSPGISQETKKLVVSTCRSIVKFEASIRKLESKSDELEPHRSNGTIPKDLLLPKKKALFGDQQSTVDGILQKAMLSLLQHRIEEIPRKVQESKTRKALIEKEFLLSMQTSSNAQLKLLTEEEVDKIAIVKQRHTLNVRSFYSQLAIARENDFLRSKREAKKKEGNLMILLGQYVLNIFSRR